jgi:hypothetical protein
MSSVVAIQRGDRVWSLSYLEEFVYSEHSSIKNRILFFADERRDKDCVATVWYDLEAGTYGIEIFHQKTYNELLVTLRIVSFISELELKHEYLE